MTSEVEEVLLRELILREYDVDIPSDVAIFQGTGWWWQGSTDAKCGKCENTYDVYRRPSVKGDFQIQYWAIACVTCQTLATLDELPEATKKSIKSEYYLPPVSVADAAMLPQRTAQVKAEIKFSVTDEQLAAIEAVRKFRKVGIQALAGTGKTTTLTLIATELDNRSVQYIAFNKAIVNEVRSKMSPRVTCNTAHSLAFKAVGHNYSERLNGGGVKDYRKVAAAFDVNRTSFQFRDWHGTYSSSQVAQMANLAVGSFVKSVDGELSLEHVEPQIHPFVDDPSTRRNIAEYVLPIAKAIWDDLRRPAGLMKFEHDHYLKMWQLREPRIDKDLILFDEAQDADPVMVDIITRQKDAQLVFCGDSYQQIYEWRGASDAMRAIAFDRQTWLTQSFRFGPAIAAQANEVLTLLNPKIQIVGLKQIQSTCDSGIRPNVILCRTNAGLMSNIAHYLRAGFKVATTVDRGQMIAFFRECIRLQRNQEVSHQELSAFHSWAELEQWVSDFPAEAGELGSMVRLVTKFGADVLINSLNECTVEEDANIVVTTAHRAKGREWNNVKIDSDFPHISDMEDADLRLLYVAMTRAKLNLDISAWEAVESNPNRYFSNFLGATGVPLPRLQQTPKQKPRRRDV